MNQKILSDLLHDNRVKQICVMDGVIYIMTKDSHKFEPMSGAKPAWNNSEEQWGAIRFMSEGSIEKENIITFKDFEVDGIRARFFGAYDDFMLRKWDDHVA